MLQGINPTALALNAGALAEYGNFAKAVAQTSAEFNPALKTGIAALQPESLSSVLRKVVETELEMKMMNRLKRQPVDQVMHFWQVEDDLGGQPGAVFQQEIESIATTNSSIKRYAILLKVAARRRVISRVLKATKTIVDEMALYRKDMVTEIHRGNNIAAYYGDDAVSPFMPNGIKKQIQTNNPEMLYNMNGETDINVTTKAVFEYVRMVRGLGSFGRTDTLFMDLDLQNEFDASLFPQYRVQLGSDAKTTEIGSPVTAIKTSFGKVEMENDVYMESYANTLPKSTKPIPAEAPGQPSVAAAPVAATVVNSKVTAGRNGLYNLTVEPIDAHFLHGTAAAITSVTIPLNGAADITITPNGDGKAYGYALYFSVKAPASAPGLKDLRLAVRIPHPNPNALTTPFVYRFYFDDIPGSSSIFGMSMVEDAIGYAELLPPTQFDLAAVDSAIVPFAVLQVGTPVLWKPNNHFVLKNILPSRASWKPFG